MDQSIDQIELKPGEKDLVSPEITYPICSERIAQSLVKAFSHAIKKAGGKKPLF